MTDLLTHRLELPAGERAISKMRAGDIVALTGDIVVTAGLPTHARIIEYLDRQQQIPAQLRNGGFFHLGCSVTPPEAPNPIDYLNPTTSTRFNSYMPRLIKELGLRAVGGKGGLDTESMRAMQEAGCVYLSFLGGGATLFTPAVEEVIDVQWADLTAHYRLTTLRVRELGPLTVAIDSHGRSLYDELASDAVHRLPQIITNLREDRVRTLGKL